LASLFLASFQNLLEGDASSTTAIPFSLFSDRTELSDTNRRLDPIKPLDLARVLEKRKSKGAMRFTSEREKSRINGKEEVNGEHCDYL
jgi:hypothetical protein